MGIGPDKHMTRYAKHWWGSEPLSSCYFPDPVINANWTFSSYDLTLSWMPCWAYPRLPPLLLFSTVCSQPYCEYPKCSCSLLAFSSLPKCFFPAAPPRNATRNASFSSWQQQCGKDTRRVGWHQITEIPLLAPRWKTTFLIGHFPGEG